MDVSFLYSRFDEASNLSRVSRNRKESSRVVEPELKLIKIAIKVLTET
jgi:hypothetical protein